MLLPNYFFLFYLMKRFSWNTLTGNSLLLLYFIACFSMNMDCADDGLNWVSNNNGIRFPFLREHNKWDFIVVILLTLSQQQMSHNDMFNLSLLTLTTVYLLNTKHVRSIVTSIHVISLNYSHCINSVFSNIILRSCWITFLYIFLCYIY